MGCTTTARLAAALTLWVTWARGVAFLHDRHPHEDAFILYRYAENLSAGRGIVFNAPGPPTEGATDFLWMLFIAAGNVLGLDSAIAALLLSACGASMLSYVLVRAWTEDSSSHLVALGGFCLGLAVPFLPPAHSAYAGFSTFLYCGSFAMTLWLVSRETTRTAVLATYTSLALGLLRPDGVILAAGCYALAFVLTPAEGRRRLAIHGTIAVLLAGAYFVWRYHYFGHLLPLPLYVKSRAVDEVARLQMNLRWLESGLGPGPLLLAAAVLAALAGLKRSLRPLLLALPGLLLFVALWRAHQTQNVDWRFQAPVYTGLIVAVAMLASRVLSRRNGTSWISLVSIVMTIAIGPAIYTGRYVFDRDYMDSAAVKLGRLLDGRTIAATEAGRLPYWTNGMVIDVVGLNTAETALHPPSISFLESIDPDVVLFHVAGTLDGRKLLRRSQRRANVAFVRPKQLQRAVRGPYRKYLDLQRDAYRSDDVPTKMAAVVLADFLSRQSDYRVVAVRYGGGFKHVYGFKKELEDLDLMLEVLKSASPDAVESSYAAAKGIDLRWTCRVGLWLSPDLDARAHRCTHP